MWGAHGYTSGFWSLHLGMDKRAFYLLSLRLAFVCVCVCTHVFFWGWGGGLRLLCIGVLKVDWLSFLGMGGPNWCIMFKVNVRLSKKKCLKLMFSSVEFCFSRTDLLNKSWCLRHAVPGDGRGQSFRGHYCTSFWLFDRK